MKNREQGLPIEESAAEGTSTSTDPLIEASQRKVVEDLIAWFVANGGGGEGDARGGGEWFLAHADKAPPGPLPCDWESAAREGFENLLRDIRYDGGFEGRDLVLDYRIVDGLRDARALYVRRGDEFLNQGVDVSLRVCATNEEYAIEEADLFQRQEEWRTERSEQIAEADAAYWAWHGPTEAELRDAECRAECPREDALRSHPSSRPDELVEPPGHPLPPRR